MRSRRWEAHGGAGSNGPYAIPNVLPFSTGGAGDRGHHDIQLSPREREVLVLLAEGMRTQEVADRLSLSPVTVRTYVERSMEKLGAVTRTHAVAVAFAIGAL